MRPMDSYKKKAKNDYVYIADDVTLGPFCSNWIKKLAEERESKLEKEVNKNADSKKIKNIS